MSAAPTTSELASSPARHSFAASGGSPSRRTHLDLFSGIGGFALAARWNGIQTVGFAEIEPYACRLLKHHWPDVPNYGDIRNIRGLNAWLVTGGFPCQPFSSAGKRTGKTDDRYLWPEMGRVIADVRPAWVLAENVPDLDGVALDDVLADLESIGYETAPPIEIPAAAVGAPHKRNRLWIVAHANSGRQQERTKLDGEEEQAASDRNPCGKHTDRRGNTVAHADRQSMERTPIAWQERNPWATEPAVGRVANGVSRRVDRLKGLGNAIVPQIAANLIRWMLEAEQAQVMENE